MAVHADRAIPRLETDSDGQSALPGMEDTGEANSDAQSGSCGHGPETPCLPCDTGPCPACGKPSFWHRSINQWMHGDGTCAGSCWRWQP